jgi:hypothetical protein
MACVSENGDKGLPFAVRGLRNSHEHKEHGGHHDEQYNGDVMTNECFNGVLK